MASPYLYPSRGGVQTYVLHLSKQLVAAGHDVWIVTTRDRAVEGAPFVGGVPVAYVPRTAVISKTPVGIGWTAELGRIVDRHRPDVVNAHLPVPYLADMTARAAGGVPFVLTYHNDLVKRSLAGRAAGGVYYRSMGRATLASSSRIITTSKRYAERSPYLSAHMDKVRIVPPGVDTTAFHPGLDSTWLERRIGGGPRILFVGSLDRSHAHKGLDRLIGALSGLLPEFPSARLVVVGSGSATATHQAMVAQRHLAGHVVFVGRVSDEELPLYYRGSDVLVLPSSDDAEGFGMVLQEAAACGTAIVGTNVGGIPAAIEHIGTGALSERDEASLAAVVGEVLRRGRPRRAAPRPYTWRAAATETFAVYSEAAA